MNISIIVLSYNHEDFICDCLESIKYQVETYGKKDDIVEVVVADDCSTDDTVNKVVEWKEQNKGLFNNFLLMCNEHNIGTCNNYENALLKASGDYVKIIGGDDLFPVDSMFKVFGYLDQYDIVTGLPFEYIVGKDNTPLAIQKLTHKRQCINRELENKTFYELIERSCFLNAPATYIRKGIATNPEVVAFVRSFIFTEDYPQWVKASELKTIKFKILNSYTVIYRRTIKSAFIVKGIDPRFLNDRVKIYKYLFDRTNSWFTKFTIYCHLYAFKKGRLMPNKFFNTLSYLNRYYWYKNRKKVNPISLDAINKNLNFIVSVTSRR